LRMQCTSYERRRHGHPTYFSPSLSLLCYLRSPKPSWTSLTLLY
jgi:hypothetical protein